MITFHGKIDPSTHDRYILAQEDGGEQVRVNTRLDLRNHSPTGVAWGFMGSGASQASLAILAYYLGDEKAIAFYMFFKWNCIGLFEQDEEWTLTSDQIDTIIDDFVKSDLTEIVHEKSVTH